jgi:hypothetical protein
MQFNDSELAAMVELRVGMSMVRAMSQPALPLGHGAPPGSDQRRLQS